MCRSCIYYSESKRVYCTLPMHFFAEVTYLMNTILVKNALFLRRNAWRVQYIRVWTWWPHIFGGRIVLCKVYDMDKVPRIYKIYRFFGSYKNSEKGTLTLVVDPPPHHFVMGAHVFGTSHCKVRGPL